MAFASDKRIWTASAPSNIALIKYMGKVEGGEMNRPANSSLSMTLPHLKSFVQIEASAEKTDRWEPLKKFENQTFDELKLSDASIDRFMKHLQFLKAEFFYKGSFIVRSANNFPADCGLASSASSFAALTKVAMLALSDIARREPPDMEDVAEFSRAGSGSSCRSFFVPWALWTPDGVMDVPELSKLNRLEHMVIVVDDGKKEVSSSEAHKRVTTSPQFKGRPARAEERLRSLKMALTKNEWQKAYDITWAEFTDMHSLFESSVPPFSYMTAKTRGVLDEIKKLTWTEQKDGPLITMDAGANVHLIFREDQHAMALQLAKAMSAEHRVIGKVTEKITPELK